MRFLAVDNAFAAVTGDVDGHRCFRAMSACIATSRMRDIENLDHLIRPWLGAEWAQGTREEASGILFEFSFSLCYGHKTHSKNWCWK
jgi:hypothetical protein